MYATSGSGRSILAGCICLVAAVAAPVASGDDPPPGGPAIGQYVETVPSGSGGRAVGVGQWHVVPLSKKAQSKLKQKQTPLAPKLQSIATSSNYGAPQNTLPRARQSVKPKPRKTPNGANPKPSTPSVNRTSASAQADRNALSAAVSAATGSGSRAPLILLVVIVLLTTAAGLVAAAKRARQQR